jgi:hypothetical protein
MATLLRTPPAQHWIVRFLPLQTLQNAQELARRFRNVEGLRLYAHERLRLLFAAISLDCAIGVVVFLGDRHSLLALLGVLLLPVTLGGSFFVMAYVFFSWIESRALVRELGHRYRSRPSASASWLSKNFGLDIGPVPPVPWTLAALLLFLPLALLASAWPTSALVAIVLGLLLPVVYAKFDT